MPETFPIHWRDLLICRDYDPAEIIGRGIDTADMSMGAFASVLMINRHIQLAQMLIDQGVEPEWIPQFYLGHIFHHQRMPDKAPLGMSMMWRFWDMYDFDERLGPVVGTGWEALDAMLSKPDVWPVDASCMIGGKTLLSEIPAPFNPQTRKARKRLFETFLSAGADINQHSETHNALSKSAWSCADHNFTENANWRQVAIEDAYSTKSAYEAIISFGFDLTLHPHIALSEAIVADERNTDVDSTHSELGIRAGILMDLGLPAHAPVDCPAIVNPFVQAVRLGHQSTVRALLKRGCNPAWIDPDTGDTIFAIGSNEKSFCVNALMTIPSEALSGVINHANHKGDTPLHHAVAALSLPLVRKIVEAGGNINALNHKGQLPLQTVKRNNAKAKKKLEEIIEYLDSAGAQTSGHEVPGMLHHACKTLAHTLVAKLLDRGADVHALDNQGRTPLLVLAQSSKINYYDEKNQKEALRSYELLIESLIRAGADIHARDKKGNTALHWAVETMSPLMVKALLSHGADPGALNKKQSNPTHTWNAAHLYHNDPQHPASLIIRLFADHGFDPTAEGPNGELPFGVMRSGAIFQSVAEQWTLRQTTPVVSGAQSSGRGRL